MSNADRPAPRRRKRKGKYPASDAQVSFGLYEALHSVLRDLARIDRLIPSEVSRIPEACCKSESDAIIVGRKDDLLNYIQTICRDHLHWGGKQVQRGWTLEQHNKGFSQGNGKYVKPKPNERFNPDKW